MIKNKLLRILSGEILLMMVLVLTMSIIKMIPVEKTVENNDGSITSFLKIYEKDSFTTTFSAVADNLNRIDVLFKNPNLESRDEIEIYILEGKKVVFHQYYNGYNFGDTSHARTDFPAIVDSRGKEYEVVVKLVKNVDGKLELGIKNGDINFIQYYGEKLSLIEAINASMTDIINVIRNQTIVLVLPMILWGIFLW